MSKRKIVIEPDPILRKKSEKLGKVDDDLRKLLDEMLETMYAAPGIGLAAIHKSVLYPSSSEQFPFNFLEPMAALHHSLFQLTYFEQISKQVVILSFLFS